ncbi:MAG: F0F1 ATP synthase subunit A [Chloroflexi bacterium]|nr:F0F1 ATP synthase subunit A [Chloroflexota bacterium]
MSGSGPSRQLLKLGLIIVGLLFISGCVLGPIGNAFFGTPELLPKPKIHLVGEPIIPNVELAEGQGLTQSKFYVTNTMLASWITVLVLVAMFYLATRKIKEVPGRLQSALEGIIEALLSLAESVVGKERARAVFPLVATIFLYVLFNAWLSLLPVYEFLGIKGAGHLEKTLLRNPNTDINVPLSLALFAFVAVEFWGMRYVGVTRYIGQFLNFSNLRRGKVFVGVIDLFVGGLEGLSHMIRIISFTFRLFGNMTAGFILLLIASFLIPFVFSVVFYGLEILVGFVQALIFAGLTLVFAALAMTPPHGEEHH